jgi:uncharacterized membrane protein YqjE
MTPQNPHGTSQPGSLRALSANLIALVCDRAELIAVEFQEAKARNEQKIILLIVAALFITMGMLLAAFLVIVLFWDTHRMLAAGGVTALYLAIGVSALMRLRTIHRNSPAPFAATMSEFANDLRLFREQDE